MSLATRSRERVRTTLAAPVRRSPADTLFVAVTALLLAVHLTIFVATLVVAPVTPVEQRSLQLLQLPVEVARAMVLPFHALLLGCLFVLGRRAAGRWAGFGSMLAVLALDLRADPTDIIYGPAVATGGWVAASLLAAAFVLLPSRRLAAAALIGAASGFAGLAALALPAFLIALALRPPQPGVRRRNLRESAAFAGVWAAAAAAMQLIWLARLGTGGWLARLGEYLAEFRPHALVPFLEQQRIVFNAWHFPAAFTFSIALFLFATAIIGVIRYFMVPRPEESGPAVLRVLQRFPVEFWAAGLTMLLFGVWWQLSGWTVVVDPELPVLGSVAPLITAMAYRGSKWLLTLGRFWRFAATVYLIGLITARSTQLVITLIHSFHA